MAYQIEKTYTSFWGWISDDDFLGSEYAVKDLDGIDVQTQEGYAQAMRQYSTLSGDYSLAWGASWVKETPASLFVSNVTLVQRNWSTVSLPASAYNCESYWTGTSQVNYFFLADRIRPMNYDGSATAWADITTNYPTYSSILTRPVIGWHVTNLLFSKDDKIYFLDTVNNAITVTASTATQLMKGSVVKCIYSYSYESTVVVATNNGNTYIYELDFTGWAYSIARKIEIVGYECTHAEWNGFDVFWKSPEGIHQYQGGQSVFIKKLEVTAHSLAFNKVLKIGTTNDIYELWAIKPWRNNILTKNTTTSDFITKSYVIDNVSGGYKIYSNVGNSYKRTNTIELLPVTGWAVGILKKDLNFQLGYMFDLDSYTNSATRQEVVVKVQTDWMGWTPSVEIARVTDWDTLDTLGNKRYGYMKLAPQMVTNALTTAWYTTEWLYANVTIELLAWDEYVSPAWYYRKTPKLFDFTVKANFKNG